MADILVRNRTAWFGWGLMMVWLTMLGIVTGLVAREGSFGDMPPLMGLGLLTLMWVFGAGFGLFFFGKPTITLLRSNGRLVVRRRWLLRHEEDAFSPGDVPLLRIIETCDSEGDPYFELHLILDRGEPVTIAEGHDRPKVEQEKQRIEDVIRAA